MSQFTSGSCDFAAAVTPSDSTVLPPFQMLYVGGTGAVTVTLLDGTDVVFSAIPVGTFLPIRGTKVKAATSATLIVAMW